MFDPRELPDRCNNGHYVYALIDPETRRRRYIGCTRNPRKRWSHHCSHRKLPFNASLQEWIRGLRERGQRPEFEILVHLTGSLSDIAGRAAETEIIRWWSSIYPGELLQKKDVVPIGAELQIA